MRSCGKPKERLMGWVRGVLEEPGEKVKGDVAGIPSGDTKA
jgi:hypothetical protein